MKAFLAWEAKLWADRSEKRKKIVDERLQEGLSAYALRQANIRSGMKMKIEELWRYVDSWIIGVEIPADGDEGDADDEDQRDDGEGITGEGVH